MLRCQTRWIGVRCGVLGSGSDPSGQNQTLCFDVRPGESGFGVGSLGPVPPSGQNQTRIWYASIFRAECEKCGVWFCPLGGTGSSPGSTRTKLLQDTIKQYPGLCASFFLNTIPYIIPASYPNHSWGKHLLTRYPDKNLDKILPAMSQSCLQDFGQDLARGPLGQYRDMS